jgi:hypothetical protein
MDLAVPFLWSCQSVAYPLQLLTKRLETYILKLPPTKNLRAMFAIEMRIDVGVYG